MSARCLVLTLSVCFLFPSSAIAELLFTFAPSADGNSTVIAAQGTVDVRNLPQFSSNGINQVSAYNLPTIDRPLDQRFFSNHDGTSKGWTIGAAFPIFDVVDPFTFANIALNDSNQTGDSFGLQSSRDLDRLDQTSLIVPTGFTVGEISGSAVLEGVKLAELNPIEGLYSFGPSIDQQIRLAVVPEPALAATAMLLLATFGRRSSR